MEPSHEPERTSAPGTTREALMDAALALLVDRGVLAGLNLREVAESAGVTPANIYHLFGSRQGLLRAALAREADTLIAPLAALEGADFVERRIRMFDVIATEPALALTALLALDRDEGYRPLPFIDATRAQYQKLVDEGRLPAALDIDAAHLLVLATSIGVAIYAEAAARQLGVDVDDVRRRTREVLRQMLVGLVAGAPDDAPDGGS